MESRFMRSHAHINIHPVERWIRIVIGTVLVIMAFTAGPGIDGWYLLGVLPLLTGIAGWCPIYYFLGINTNRLARVKVDHSKR